MLLSTVNNNCSSNNNNKTGLVCAEPARNLTLPTYLILQFSRWSGQANSIATGTVRHACFVYFIFTVFFSFFFFFVLFWFFPPATKKRNPGVKLSFGTLYKTCPSAHFRRLVLRQTISQDLSFGTLYKSCPYRR